MKLEDLTGEHILTGYGRIMGVNHVISRNPYKKEIVPERFYFTLDDISFVTEEDPDDGYRSLMKEIRVAKYLPKSYVDIIPTKVICEMGFLPKDEEIMYMYDFVTEKPVIEVGTDYSDNYYPCFVANIYPENMACNNQQEEITYDE